MNQLNKIIRILSYMGVYLTVIFYLNVGMKNILDNVLMVFFMCLFTIGTILNCFIKPKIIKK